MTIIEEASNPIVQRLNTIVELVVHKYDAKFPLTLTEIGKNGAFAVIRATFDPIANRVSYFLEAQDGGDILQPATFVVQTATEKIHVVRTTATIVQAAVS